MFGRLARWGWGIGFWLEVLFFGGDDFCEMRVGYFLRVVGLVLQ